MPMRTEADLPCGVVVVYRATDRDFEAYYASRRLLRLKEHEPVHGFVIADRPHSSDHWIVRDVCAAHGWGPLLYDLLLDHSRRCGTRGVTPSRRDVSEEALAVWTHYHRSRADVGREPLPEGVEQMAPYSIEGRTPTSNERDILDALYHVKSSLRWERMRIKCRLYREGGRSVYLAAVALVFVVAVVALIVHCILV